MGQRAKPNSTPEPRSEADAAGAVGSQREQQGRPPAQALFSAFVRNSNTDTGDSVEDEVLAAGAALGVKTGPGLDTVVDLEAPGYDATLSPADLLEEASEARSKRRDAGREPSDAAQLRPRHLSPAWYWRRETSTPWALAACRPGEVGDRESASQLRESTPGEGGAREANAVEVLLGELSVLHRYGYQHDVDQRLERCLARSPEDLLLLRRVSDFYLQHGRLGEGKQYLFVLASRLLDQLEAAGARRVLERVLELDPQDNRARRLLSRLSG